MTSFILRMASRIYAEINIIVYKSNDGDFNIVQSTFILVQLFSSLF